MNLKSSNGTNNRFKALSLLFQELNPEENVLRERLSTHFWAPPLELRTTVLKPQKGDAAGETGKCKFGETSAEERLREEENVLFPGFQFKIRLYVKTF